MMHMTDSTAENSVLVCWVKFVQDFYLFISYACILYYLPWDLIYPAVIKLFIMVIYHLSMVMISFCAEKPYYLKNYCGMAVNCFITFAPDKAIPKTPVICYRILTQGKEGTTVNDYIIFDIGPVITLFVANILSSGSSRGFWIY
jgi:hypothetical protein